MNWENWNEDDDLDLDSSVSEDNNGQELASDIFDEVSRITDLVQNGVDTASNINRAFSDNSPSE